MTDDLISSLKSWAKQYDKPWIDDYAKGFRAGVFVAIEAVKELDAAPVRRGKWIEEQGQTFIPVEYDEFDNPILHDYILYRCSQCGRIENKKEPYCNCGADMREVNMLVTPPIC